MAALQRSTHTLLLMDFIPLNDPNDVDDLFDRSETEPVVLFKHSATCGLSAQAKGEMLQLLEDGEPPIFQVIVQHARDVSNLLAERTGVRHESPQALVIHSGEVIFDTSHRGVTAAKLREVVAGLGPAVASR